MIEEYRKEKEIFKKAIEAGEFKGEKVEEVGMASIIPGDAILCDDGEFRTVSGKDIHYNDFIGHTIFGKSYMSGYQKAVRFVCPVWHKGVKIRG